MGRAVKECYVTGEELEARADVWMGEVEPYCSGGDRVRFDPGASVLLVIDMQRFFLDEASHACLPAGKVIVPVVGDLVRAYRARSLPVVFTRHGHSVEGDVGMMGRWWGDVLREDSALGEIVPELAPLPSERVVRKERYSAFKGTGLGEYLAARQVRRVVVTGVMTHLCCEGTARDAFMEDFGVFFVVDGTASINEALHVASLKTAAHGFAVPVRSRDILKDFAS